MDYIKEANLGYVGFVLIVVNRFKQEEAPGGTPPTTWSSGPNPCSNKFSHVHRFVVLKLGLVELFQVIETP